MVDGVPARGDLVRISFQPQRGHEQGGQRPALVLSNTAYNARAGMIVCCPVTSSIKGYSTEVPLPAGLQTASVVLTTQVRALGWRACGAELIEPVPEELLERVLDILIAVIERWYPAAQPFIIPRRTNITFAGRSAMRRLK